MVKVALPLIEYDRQSSMQGSVYFPLKETFSVVEKGPDGSNDLITVLEL